MARLRYIGGGFIGKVPARDLSAEEVKRYGLERLLASKLYIDLYPPKPAKAKKHKPEPEIEPVEEPQEPEPVEDVQDLIEED